MNQGTLVGPKACPYVMEPWASIDIDSEWEFELAELVMRSPRGKVIRES
jgi:CMP-N-acetylneuraminic acid synthetase